MRNLSVTLVITDLHSPSVRARAGINTRGDEYCVGLLAVLSACRSVPFTPSSEY